MTYNNNKETTAFSLHAVNIIRAQHLWLISYQGVFQHS